MNKGHVGAICAVCVFSGAILPWALLVAGGIMSVLASSDYWNETAAYMSLFGLLLLAISYIVAKLGNNAFERG